MRRPDFPPQESAFSTEFGNKVIENPEIKTPDISELHKSALLEIAAVFKAAGVHDWAIAGSMQKILVGIQDVKDIPGDIDIVTTKPGVMKLWDAVQSGDLSFGGKATFEEPKEYDANEKYGKSTVLAINIEDPILGTLEIEIFGEGDKDVGTYGGSVQLGNENRKAEIWKMDGDIQILSEQDQRRQYLLVMCNELGGEAYGKKEKIASRFVSLLQYAEDHPDDIHTDIEVLSNEYSHLPKTLAAMVQNMGTLMKVYPSFREVALKRIGGEPKTDSLAETDVLNLAERIENITANDSAIDPMLLDGVIEYIGRVDYKVVQDKKHLRRVFEAIYTLAEHIHATYPDELDAEDPQNLRKKKISPQKRAFARALDAVSVRSGQHRGWHAEFMRVKLESLTFDEPEKEEEPEEKVVDLILEPETSTEVVEGLEEAA